jgi:vacuolar-type H+-ATPase subunit E/Vma4
VGGDARVTLDTLERATLADASEQAREIRAAAERRALQTLDATRAEAEALLAGRRARAERRAELEERRHLARARADAHALVLHAQRSVLADATEAAHASAHAVRSDPRWARLSERLAADARQRLARFGSVRISATPDGGLVAQAGSLQIDHSLGAQVERALRTLASDLQRLWQ